MDEETRLVVAPDGSAPSETETGSPPALNDAEQLAAMIVTAIDALASRLELETPHPKTARRVRGSRTVPPEFVSSMIAAVEALPLLQAFGTFDTQEARRELRSRDARRIVAERLAMLLASVNYTMEARWAKIARAALATYTLANAVADDPKHAELAAHLETLRRHLGRTNKAKKKKK